MACCHRLGRAMQILRKIALNLSALAIGGLLSFAVLETGLRIYNPVVHTVHGDEVVPPANTDEVRNNRGIAGIAPVVHIHQNSVGFRGADPPPDLADRLSIITIGGSTTHSSAQADDRTWTAVLGDEVARCFKRTWINNAGFDGHTSRAHIQLVRDYIVSLHPKVALMLVGANELYADGLLSHDHEQIGIDLQRDIGIKGALKRLLNHSDVVSLALTIYRSYRAREAGLNWSHQMTGAAMPPDGEAKLAAAREAQPAYAERLDVLIQLLRKAHTIPVLMTQPTFGGDGRDPTTGNDLSHLWYGEFWSRSFGVYNDTMRQTAKRDEVHLIDLARLMPKDTKYYYDPMHYTDAGARKVAALVEKDLLPYLAQRFPSFLDINCSLAPTGSEQSPARTDAEPTAADQQSR